MSNLTITAAIFIVSLCGYMIGEIISRSLPEHHLFERSSDIIEIVRTLVVGLVTLTLGLLMSSCKNNYDVEAAHIDYRRLKR